MLWVENQSPGYVCSSTSFVHLPDLLPSVTRYSLNPPIVIEDQGFVWSSQVQDVVGLFSRDLVSSENKSFGGAVKLPHCGIHQTRKPYSSRLTHEVRSVYLVCCVCFPSVHVDQFDVSTFPTGNSHQIFPFNHHTQKLRSTGLMSTCLFHLPDFLDSPSVKFVLIESPGSIISFLPFHHNVARARELSESASPCMVWCFLQSQRVRKGCVQLQLKLIHNNMYWDSQATGENSSVSFYRENGRTTTVQSRLGHTQRSGTYLAVRHALPSKPWCFLFNAALASVNASGTSVCFPHNTKP